MYITVTVDFDVTGKAVCGGAHLVSQWILMSQVRQ